MKKTFFTLLSLFALATLSAQTDFNKGDKVLNLGIGFGSTLYSGTGYKTTVPPISASFEYGIVDGLIDGNASIGVGGYFGYTASKYEYPGLKDFKYSSVIVGGRGSFHYSFLEKLDTYTGLSIGYNIVSLKDDNSFGTIAAESSSVYLGWYAGARYYFTNSIAAMAEVGYDIAYLNIGVAFKF